MSTIGYESWAVDLANVTAIYPFQGWEKPMVVVGFVFWIGWHIVQARMETRDYEEALRSNDQEKIDKAIDRY